MTRPDAESALTKISAGLDSLTEASNAACAVLDKTEAAFPEYDGGMAGEEDREQLRRCLGHDDGPVL